MFLTARAANSYHNVMDTEPGALDRIVFAWRDLVNWFTSTVIVKVTDSYWAIAHTDLVVGGLIALVLVLIIAAVVLLLKRGGAASAGKPMTVKDFMKSAKRAAKSGNWVRAGEHYEQAEKYEKAVEAYMRGNAYTKAAQVQAKKLDQPDLALKTLIDNKLWEPAGRLLSSLGRHAEAARHYQKSGKEQMAAESFEKAGEFATAADLYRKQQRFPEAARCYGQAKSWGPAGEMHVAMYKQFKEAVGTRLGGKELAKLQDMAKKAAFYLKQAGSLKAAAEVLLDARLPLLAAEIMVMNGDFLQAAELLAENKELKRAAELFHKAGDKRRAAELLAAHYQAEGQPREAAKFLELSENYLAAADVWAGQSDFEKAAGLYLKGGDSRTAAEMYQAAGMMDLAIKVLEQVGDVESAARIVEEAGDPMALASMYERQKKFYEAAVIYYDNGHPELAGPLFSKIGPDHPSFGDATYRLGMIFMGRQMYDQALEKFQAMASRLPISSNTLDQYYMLGQALELSNHPNYAINVYYQIAALNQNYRDVAMRFNSLAQKAQQQQAATMPGMTPSGSGVAHRYRQLKELGRGGMGIVYLAEDTKLQRKVAMKLLPEEFKSNREMVESFTREALSLAKLSHPYIVSLIDAGEEAGNYYIIMEYVEGRNFKEITGSKKRLPLAAAGLVFTQLCQALDYAHGMQIIHRDIKPANIMWIQNHNIIKIMDFGLAKVMDKMRERRTVVAGTPYYMSPEQTLGKNVDHRSDIYSAGVTMYELLTGRVPFKDGDIGYAHIHTAPDPPRKYNAQIPAELEQIVLKCMAKDQNQRYQSGKQIYDELTLLTQRSQ